MVALDSFTNEQRELLVALPYRVGLWVSESDKTGGDESDEAEMQALETIVTGFAEDFLKSEFIQRMMEETVSRKDSWKNWQDHLDEVPAECKQALDLLSERLDHREIASFKITVMDIAVFVALAYRELDDDGNMGIKLKAYIRLMMQKIRSMVTGSEVQTMSQLLNISESEQRALNTLQKVLDAGRPIRRNDNTAESA